jgi:hypothetical protein
VRTLSASNFLRERYPEFATSRERATNAVNDFNFLATFYAGAHDTHVIGSWTTYYEGGVELSRRLRESAGYRARVAEQALGLPVDDLEAHGQEWLASAWSQPGYHNSEAHLQFDR